MAFSKRMTALVCAGLLLVTGASCSKNGTGGANGTDTVVTAAAEKTVHVTVDKAQSKFRDVSFDGTNLIYICEVRLENSGTEDEKVNLTAVLDWEKENGILVDSRWIGRDTTGERVFTVKAGGSLTTYVEFPAEKVATYFEEAVKQNSRLPKIEVSLADAVTE